MTELSSQIWSDFGNSFSQVVFYGVVAAMAFFAFRSIASGLLVKMFSEFQPGDQVIIDGEEGIICNVGLFQTKVSIINGKLKWRYIPNSQLFNIRMERVILTEEQLYKKFQQNEDNKNGTD
ncbi:MAG: mechanosensitive ion channel [Candidatus Thiodiazotropha taylori]|uniref:Mechanosensitive ion channel n=1 Tax=Candidatus Thiodiazotropha taylori TaxID=2792791 RepID=A0A9E4N1K2_9GAMM|nr:mechanosensitive ion channel [Candidatus Thiodiazotropha taylori]MCW4254992.1 mechanosensitive ion channel [Candidatus Thiodiazotropha taylori]